MRRLLLALSLTLSFTWLWLPTAAAGLYSLEEPLLFQVNADGHAVELAFQASEATPFRIRLNTAMNWLNANPTTKNDDRDKLMQKLHQPTGRTPAEVSTRAAILLRLGKSSEALELLAPLKRGGDFRILANLAHTHALRGEWPEARRVHEEAILDATMPTDLYPGITPEQLRWLKRVEREFYTRWLRLREQREQDRVQRRSRPEEERIFPLFGELTFETNGSYVPGQMPSDEQAKLPPDAVAIVQQLLLWEPNDGALYWLLGELYAARGKLREALAILDNCASESRQYSNRAVLMKHRAVLREAVAKLPAETQALDLPLTTPSPGPAEDPWRNMPPLWAIGVGAVVFLLFTGLMLWLRVRTWLHQRRGR